MGMGQRERGRHPIGVVAQRTELSPETLRAWERRHAVVRPTRSEGGQRLYSDADVERLHLLHLATRAGRSIGQIAGLPEEELRELVRSDLASRVRGVGEVAELGPADAARARALEAIAALDGARLEGELRRALVALDAASFLDQLMAPLLREVGIRWQAGTMGIAHEHLASAVTRRVLGRMLDTGVGSGAPELVVATPATQVHEFGAMLAGAAAVGAGWGVIYLGADLPAAEIAGAARQRGARAVALSVVSPAAPERVEEELRALRERLPAWTPLLVGGASAERHREVLHEIGATRLTSLPALRQALERIAAEG